jgi:protein gp37
VVPLADCTVPEVPAVSKETGISWCDHTFNCWWGCTKVGGSSACDNCYAETWAKRTGFTIWGDDKPRRYFGDKHWNEPLAWDRAAAKEGKSALVFCMSMGDWAEGRPEQRPHLSCLWALQQRTQNLIWLMLTKRPQLIGKLAPTDEASPRRWFGVTAESQAWLDLRWSHLKQVESPVYWLSMEPLMERVTLPQDFLDLGRRAWVIVGGESGGQARPMHPDWARHLRNQCREAGVPFHFKQWGEWVPVATPRMNAIVGSTLLIHPDGTTKAASWSDVAATQGDLWAVQRIGKTKAGNHIDGVQHLEFPR